MPKYNVARMICCSSCNFGHHLVQELFSKREFIRFFTLYCALIPSEDRVVKGSGHLRY